MKVYQIKEIQPVFTRLNNLYTEKDKLDSLKQKLSLDDHNFSVEIIMHYNCEDSIIRKWDLNGFDCVELEYIRKMRLENIYTEIEKCVTKLMELGIEVESD